MDARRSPVPVRWGVLLATGATLAALGTATAGPATASAGTAPATHANRPLAASASSGGGWSDGLWGDPLTDLLFGTSYGTVAAQQDAGSLYNVERSIGVRSIWNSRDAGWRNVTGQGVGVALLDSGVAEVPGLDAPGKVTHGPDLSIEGNGVLTDQDTYGHGTFMAGIIAGRGTTGPSALLPLAAPNVQLGVAPDAKLLSMKLATTDGSTDVSQVIAALDWVTQHPVLPDGTRVRVVNLSYGTESAQGYQLDPLAAAAENAWRHGIVVVTSAGNTGTEDGRLTDPAIDPYVLAVGAAASNDQLDGWTHSQTAVADFSAVGDGVRNPDLIAPGTSIVSLRAPGSYIDVNHPEGLVTGDTSGRLFRGSGTSQATAVVTGVVADLLQAYPNLTPDQVKYALVASAQQVRGSTAAASGAGIVNAAGALEIAGRLAGGWGASALRAAAVQSFPQSAGQGSIDAARGGAVLVDPDGNDLSGEIDVQGMPWDPEAWYQASSTLTAWSGGSWLGTVWTGDGWDPSTGQYDSARWSSARWSSARWSSARWSSARWSSARWSSARWSSARWSSARWSSARWSSADW
ncbi:MAG TPA: S8 family serine peptidase [Jatrophihabitans sp.]|nr:S8 family serine peptidase [Jatrophihabitans sp.]